MCVKNQVSQTRSLPKPLLCHKDKILLINIHERFLKSFLKIRYICPCEIVINVQFPYDNSYLKHLSVKVITPIFTQRH